MLYIVFVGRIEAGQGCGSWLWRNWSLIAKAKIGIAGTGFIGRGLALALEARDDLALSAVLTRRRIESVGQFPRPDKLTNSLSTLIDKSDLIVECTGDVIHATDIVAEALYSGRPVVTMNAEFHVTTGSYFVNRGLLTEAEGDQPGCIAALAERTREMGFTPVVYGNRKGYFQPNPPVDQMQYWARKQGISLEQVTAFTDGTKVQIEAVLIANGLGAKIAKEGLLGLEADDLQSGGIKLARAATRLGSPISDYVLAPKAPPGYFIVATCDSPQRGALEYLKFGRGPYYVLAHNDHLCHLEIPKTIRRVLKDGRPLLTNSDKPTVSVGAIAKRPLQVGDRISRGIGGFDLRGAAIRMADHPTHIPIRLVTDAIVTRPVEPGQQLTFDDVSIPNTNAVRVWKEIATGLERVAA